MRKLCALKGASDGSIDVHCPVLLTVVAEVGKFKYGAATGTTVQFKSDRYFGEGEGAILCTWEICENKYWQLLTILRTPELQYSTGIVRVLAL